MQIWCLCFLCVELILFLGRRSVNQYHARRGYFRRRRRDVRHARICDFVGIHRGTDGRAARRSIVARVEQGAAKLQKENPGAAISADVVTTYRE